jgi:cytochrome c
LAADIVTDHVCVGVSIGAKMKSMLIAVAAAAALVGAGAVSAQEDVAKSAGCLNCHATDTKKVGPAFKDVAAKYKGKADAEATLTKAITEGKGHPKTSAKPEDVTKLVKWVLSM